MTLFQIECWNETSRSKKIYDRLYLGNQPMVPSFVYNMINSLINTMHWGIHLVTLLYTE